MISETPLHALVARAIEYTNKIIVDSDGYPMAMTAASMRTLIANAFMQGHKAALLLTAGPQETPIEPEWTEEEIAALRVDFEAFARRRNVSPEVFAIVCPWADELVAQQEHRQVHVICPQCGTPFETEVLL